MARESLLKVVKVMFAMLALAFVFVLLSSLSGPSRVSNPNTVFDNVEVGETALRRVGSTRVWASRLSSMQRSQAAELASFVHSPESGCDSSVKVCALAVETERAGIEIIFSAKVPPQVPASLPWYGGFVDPVSGRVYDRLGRPYKLSGQSPSPALKIVLTQPPT